MLPVAGLAKRHIAVCVILAQSWNRGSECVLSVHASCQSAVLLQTSAAMHHQGNPDCATQCLNRSAALRGSGLRCRLEILTMLLAAGHILGPVAGVGLLVVKQPANAELLRRCAWMGESGVKMITKCLPA